MAADKVPWEVFLPPSRSLVQPFMVAYRKCSSRRQVLFIENTGVNKDSSENYPDILVTAHTNHAFNASAYNFNPFQIISSFASRRCNKWRRRKENATFAS